MIIKITKKNIEIANKMRIDPVDHVDSSDKVKYNTISRDRIKFKKQMTSPLDFSKSEKISETIDNRYIKRIIRHKASGLKELVSMINMAIDIIKQWISENEDEREFIEFATGYGMSWKEQVDYMKELTKKLFGYRNLYQSKKFIIMEKYSQQSDWDNITVNSINIAKFKIHGSIHGNDKFDLNRISFTTALDKKMVNIIKKHFNVHGYWSHSVPSLYHKRGTFEQELCVVHGRFLERNPTDKYDWETIEYVKKLALAKEHIKNGGLFRLFPSGGEENSTGIFKFKSGFKNMLLDGSLDKDPMIYCFNVKGQSTQMSFEEKGEYRKKYFAYFFLKAANQDTTVLGELPPLEIILDEKYTKAEEWMSVLEKNPQDPNTALTEHYLELFK